MRVLAREMALMALDRFGQPTIDIPLQVGTLLMPSSPVVSCSFRHFSISPRKNTTKQCQTRWGESVRCLGTLGVYLNEHGQSLLILRLWPLGSTRPSWVNGASMFVEAFWLVVGGWSTD